MNDAEMCLPLWRSPTPGAAHLVMCPFAGGSGSAFRRWQEQPTAALSVSLVTWPGRDRLRHLPVVNSIAQLAARLAQELARSEVDRAPLLLAGHSMGAQVAFETCRLLERQGRAPHGLILSGCHAPHLPARRRLSHREDDDFIDELVAIGGCAAELRDNRELMSLFLPLLRADFYATESYHLSSPTAYPLLRTPTLLLCGSQDPEASRQEVRAWRPWLADAKDPVVIDGDHFYPIQQPQIFFAEIIRHFPDACSAENASHQPFSTQKGDA